MKAFLFAKKIINTIAQINFTIPTITRLHQFISIETILDTPASSMVTP